MNPKTASRPKRRSSSEIALAATLLLSVTASTLPRAARAEVPVSDSASEHPYDLLKQKADAIHQSNSESGWAYVISGSVALAVSLPGYYLSDDLFARAIYSVGQTLGVASVSYGTYLVLIDNDYRRFSENLNRVHGLTRAQRDQLSASFLIDNAERARRTRKIRVIGHALTAGLNLTSAFTSSQRELRTALLFLGGINALAALSFGLTRSEEEKLAEPLTHWQAAPTAWYEQGHVAPALALRTSF